MRTVLPSFFEVAASCFDAVSGVEGSLVYSKSKGVVKLSMKKIAKLARFYLVPVILSILEISDR